jgi:hypothetical protein
MGDESEAAMVVKVHPVIFQVIAKHCIAHLFMRQNDSWPSVMSSSKPFVYNRMMTKCSTHISSPCCPSSNTQQTSIEENFNEGLMVIALKTFMV